MPSTTQVLTESAVPVPEVRLRNLELTSPRPDAARIVIVRDTGALSKKCTLLVLIDKVPAGEILAGERLDLYVREGTRVISAEGTEGNCAKIRAEAETTATAGQIRKYRIAMNGQTFALSIEPTAY